MLTLTSPVETRYHRLPAGMKLAALAGFTFFLFLLKTPLPLAYAFLAVVALHLPAGPRFILHALKMLRPLWLFVLVVLIWHLWTGDYGSGTALILRMVTAVAAANLVTMTTRLSDMLAVFERLCAPLAPLIPPQRLALAFAMVIRFIPRLGEVMERIRDAWAARSPRRAGWRVLIPAILAALDDADHSAEALRARGGAE